MNKKFSNKNFRYGGLFSTLAILVILMTAFINVIAEKFNVEWDLTANKMYSIDVKTEEILNGLTKDVDIVFLGEQNTLENYSDAGKTLVKVLAQYDEFSHVTVKYIDPDTNPDIINELDKDGLLGLQLENLVISCEGKSKKILPQQMFYNDETTGLPTIAIEQNITGAIKYVVTDNNPKIYFSLGHGERELTDEYAGLKQIFESNNYVVDSLNLAVVDKVPDDAEILVFARPQLDLSKEEADRVFEYCKNDGNCIFLLDPVNSNKEFENFEYVLNEFNISINYDRVKENDPTRYYANNNYTFLPFPEISETTGEEDLSEFYMPFTETRSFTILSNQKDPLNVMPLLGSSDSSVGESYGVDGEDSMGPCLVGVAAEYNSAYKSKILVYGNSYILTDEGFNSLSPYSENTLQYFLAHIAWMSDAANDFVVSPKTNVFDIINVTSNTAIILVTVTVVVVPMLIIAIGLIIWLRRRRL